jgi:hypothetical protein
MTHPVRRLRAVPSADVIRLDAATVALQWSVGGMAMCWFTTRRRVVGVGYGWLLRGVYAALAALGLAAGLRTEGFGVRELSAAAVVIACCAVLAVSIVRRHAGVALAEAEHDRRSARVAAMTGIERGSERGSTRGSEFPPLLDLVPVALGVIGLIAGAYSAVDGSGSDEVVSVLRVLVGALFLGAVTDAMLLGHWYLVQPGLPRSLLNEIVGALGALWPAELVVMLLPTGMLSVLSGSVDDGWGGQLGWFWLACTITTIVLVFVTRAALRERQYSAVMAATGLLYLAILTAFGMDLVARAVLAG